MRDLLKNVKKTIERFSMLEKGDHVLAAVSGGPDSVALLRVLLLLIPEYRICLTVAHLNHGLRGAESDRDESFVREMSEEMGVGFISTRVDILAIKEGKGRSLEELGREERYRFFEEAALACGAGKIATGHHSDDQAETVMLNLIRGSGLGGLSGIPPMRDRRIIRPLLFVTKKDIHAFLHQECLPYREDSTNVTPLFIRNRIRQGLLPELSLQYNPRIVAGLCKTAEILRRDEDYLQSVIRQILLNWGVETCCPEKIIPLDQLMELHESLRARIIKYLLGSLATPDTKIGYRHIESILNLCLYPSPQSVALNLPGRILVERHANSLRFKRFSAGVGRPGNCKRKGKPIEYAYPVVIPGAIHLPHMSKTICFEFLLHPDWPLTKYHPQYDYLDYDKTIPPLILRNHKQGDRITPLGMTGTKKLHDYFIDKKIPVSQRPDIPILVDSRSVIWVAGHMISEHVKVTSQSTKVLKAEMV